MEVTKQKMRCAAAEDPSYPCKQHGEEEQVSQLPGEEVTRACQGFLPSIATGAGPGWSRTRGSRGQVRGRMVRPPGQQLPQAWEGWPASWAVRVAGPVLTITMSLCAATAAANGAERRPLLSTRGELGEGAQGAPRYSCTCTLTGTQHSSPGWGSLPKCHHPGDLSLGAPQPRLPFWPLGTALTLGTLSVPKGAALERASAPQGRHGPGAPLSKH